MKNVDTWGDLAHTQKPRMSFPHVEQPIQNKLFASTNEAKTQISGADKQETGPSRRRGAKAVDAESPTLLETESEDTTH